MIDVNGMLEKYPELSVPEGVSSLEGIEEKIIPLTKIDELIRQMDEAGIEKSVVYALEAPLVYASNEYVKDLCQRFPDRLIGFASVNPKSEKALDHLQKAFYEFSFQGLKFHPPLQDFFPNDRAIYPVYEWAQERKLPIVFHVGTTPFGSLCRLSQANPLLLDDLAVDFPSLPIILTHLGTLWQNEAFMVVEKNPNCYIDTAAYLYEIPEILDLNLVQRIGEDKIIFGTDYPMPFVEGRHEMKDFLHVIEKISLPKRIKKKIFSLNLRKLINVLG
jgi:hypothetical protein